MEKVVGTVPTTVLLKMPTVSNLLFLILLFADGKQFLKLRQVSLFFPPTDKKPSTKYSR